MPRCICIALLGGLASALIAADPARADDFSYGGAGADFVPRQETRIRMASEDIVAQVRDGAWYVDARYVFENPTDETIELSMGFPESRCTGDSDCNVEIPFRDMQTWVRGTFVKLKRGGAWLTKRFPGLGNVWTYQASFGPHERVEIRHKYHVNGSYVLMQGLEFGYVVRTGALWAGPIGRASFKFLMPPLTRYLKLPEVGKPSPPHWAVADGLVWTEVTLAFEDWTPTQDIFILFNEDLPHETWESYTRDGTLDVVPTCVLNSNDALYAADAHERETLTETWAAYGADRIRACRQRLMASYGARFHDRRLNQSFYGPHGFVDRGPPHLAFEPNARFAIGAMTPSDQIMYDALLRAERAAPAVGHLPEDTFDVTATPELTTGTVGDVVKFDLVSNYTGVNSCDLSLYGRVRFADSGAYGDQSMACWRGSRPFTIEAVVAPTEFEAWWGGDKTWLRLGRPNHGSDLGPDARPTKLARTTTTSPWVAGWRQTAGGRRR